MRKKLKEKLNRRKKLHQKQQNPSIAPCVDCGQPCLFSDIFIVRNAVWAEAGLNGWNAGHLHLACFKKRLGRDLKEGELLFWHVGGTKFQAHPDYPKSPECLKHL